MSGLEKGTEFGDDPVLDHVGGFGEDVSSGLTLHRFCWAPLVERYLQREVGIEFRVVVRSGDEETHDHLIFFERAGECLVPEITKARVRGRDLYLPYLRRRSHYVDKAVLVDVRKFVELPEREEVGVIPSVVRLKRLDPALSPASNGSDSVATTTAPRSVSERVWVKEEGELRAAGGVATTDRTRQLIYKVVETRSEVVNDVPDNHSEPQVGLTDISDADGWPLIRVELGVELIRVRFVEPLDHSVQGFEVTDRPLPFEPDSFEGVGHEG